MLTTLAQKLENVVSAPKKRRLWPDAQALGLDGVVSNLQPGCEADFVLLNPEATPLLARKTSRVNSLDELLFSLIVLGDDRLVERTVISQAIER
jgi:guanine deaminase